LIPYAEISTCGVSREDGRQIGAVVCKRWCGCVRACRGEMNALANIRAAVVMRYASRAILMRAAIQRYCYLHVPGLFCLCPSTVISGVELESTATNSVAAARRASERSHSETITRKQRPSLRESLVYEPRTGSACASLRERMFSLRFSRRTGGSTATMQRRAKKEVA